MVAVWWPRPLQHRPRFGAVSNSLHAYLPSPPRSAVHRDAPPTQQTPSCSCCGQPSQAAPQQQCAAAPCRTGCGYRCVDLRRGRRSVDLGYSRRSADLGGAVATSPQPAAAPRARASMEAWGDSGCANAARAVQPSSRSHKRKSVDILSPPAAPMHQPAFLGWGGAEVQAAYKSSLYASPATAQPVAHATANVYSSSLYATGPATAQLAASAPTNAAR